MRIANKKCIRSLSIKSMKAAKMRNLIAILAIALTTLLFTSLLTGAMASRSYHTIIFKSSSTIKIVAICDPFLYDWSLLRIKVG